MLTFEDLKDIIDALPMSVDRNDRENVQKIRLVGGQLGFSLPEHDCKCQDRYSDLSMKLKLWLKKHKDGFCKYRMKLGIVRYTPFGNCFQLVITDEMAEWILENDPEGAKFITRIVPDDVSASSNDAKEDSNIIILEKENNVPENTEIVQTQTVKKTRKRKNETK